MKKLLAWTGLALGVLLVAILARTALYSAPEPETFGASEPIVVDTSRIAAQLAQALTIRTISREEAAPDSAVFRSFHRFLSQSYPEAFSQLAVDTIAGLSLLMRWQGSSADTPPLLLLAHQDVVPAVDSAWTVPPFSGVADGQHIWGRGTIDNKSSVIAILSAIDQLLASGFRPRADVYIALGHDEEVGGTGAAAMAAELAQREVRAGLVVDEGGILGHGLMPGLDKPTAVIGIAEKGSATIELVASSTGGHSSMPPPSTSIGVLADAISRLEARAMPARIDGATDAMLRTVGPHMTWPNRIVFANRWLFDPVLERILASRPQTDATIRTTTAVTVIRGGTKRNALPSDARALVNFRLLPGDTDASVAAHVEDALEGMGVESRLLPGARNPSPTSPSDAGPYAFLERTIRRSFHYDDLVVAPYLMIGGSDARWYTPVSDYVYRFQPIDIPAADGLRLHAVDERITYDALAGMAGFYERLIRDYPPDSD